MTTTPTASEFSGHTPGPWSWMPQIDTSMPRLVGVGGYVCHFGDCTQYYPCEGEPPSEADMKLIAAAPDLLAKVTALEAALTRIAEILNTDDEGSYASEDGRGAIETAHRIATKALTNQEGAR